MTFSMQDVRLSFYIFGLDFFIFSLSFLSTSDVCSFPTARVHLFFLFVPGSGDGDLVCSDLDLPHSALDNWWKCCKDRHLPNWQNLLLWFLAIIGGFNIERGGGMFDNFA